MLMRSDPPVNCNLHQRLGFDVISPLLESHLTLKVGFYLVLLLLLLLKYLQFLMFLISLYLLDSLILPILLSLFYFCLFLFIYFLLKVI